MYATLLKFARCGTTLSIGISSTTVYAASFIGAELLFHVSAPACNVHRSRFTLLEQQRVEKLSIGDASVWLSDDEAAQLDAAIAAHAAPVLSFERASA